MRAARRTRRFGAIAVSTAFHLMVGAIVALHAPRLFIPNEPAGPPEPVIPVLLTPKLPPVSATPGQHPAPLRLHRRQLRFAPEIPIPPLPVPTLQVARPAPTPAPVARHPAPLPEGGATADLRTTLRVSPVGCANPDAVGLTKAERDACNDRLGGLSKTAPTLGLGLAGDKQGAFDRAAAKKEADRRYREAPVPPASSNVPGGSGQPWGSPAAPLPEPPRLPP